MIRLLFTILLAASSAMAASSVFDRMRDLPQAAVGEKYTAALNGRLAQSCSAPGVTWQVAAGTLPDGLRVSEGRVVGSAASVGAWEFALRASTACSDVIVPLRILVRDAHQADLISVHNRSRSR